MSNWENDGKQQLVLTEFAAVVEGQRINCYAWLRRSAEVNLNLLGYTCYFERILYAVTAGVGNRTVWQKRTIVMSGI